MTTDTVGGVWSYSIDICRSLASYGVEFCLVTTGAVLNKSQRDELEQLSNVTVYETDFLLEWMKDPWESIDASKEWLLRLEQAWQPDIVHLNCFAYGGLSWKAPTIAVAHSDVFSWWRNVKGEEPPAAWTEYYNRVKEGMNSVDLLIAPSRVKLKSLNSIYNLQTASKVIYNSRSSSQFTPATKDRVVFSMGRIWDEAKNVRLLIDAATCINYPIRIAGENQFENNRVD
ncbi:MAG TPA: glycosyltransferase, partial [Chitinophagaceae bacterium]|nr:glycosyltransferase [Chitinophagaceae bacterium]